MWRIIFLLVLAAAPPVGAQAPAASAADAASVRILVERYVDARDARDEREVAALLTADADQFTTGGDWRRGRAQVVAGTAESTRRNPGDRSIDIASVRFITPDVAIVDGNYDIAGNQLRRWTTIVVEREADGWRIAAIRNMAPTRK